MKTVHLIAVAITLLASAFFAGYYSTYLAWEDLRPWDTYRVRFQRTLGLTKDDAVFCYGYKVGRVHSIRLEGDHQLVEVQVEPSVHFGKANVSGRSYLKIVIVPTDAFGTVAIWIEPPDNPDGVWSPDEILEGTFQESLAAGGGGDSTSTSALTETLKGVEELTAELNRSDSGLVGYVLNDPDPAVSMKAGVGRLRDRMKGATESTTTFLAGEGLGGIIAKDPQLAIDASTGGFKETLLGLDEGSASAARGEGGLLGRLLGDPDVANRTRDSMNFAAGFLDRYQTGEGSGFWALVSHDPGSADYAASWLEALGDATGRARSGEGAFGAWLGPESGAVMYDTLGAYVSRLDEMTSADPSAGSILSPAPEGKRAVDDFATRIEDVLRDMRRALSRIRADQAPNTFPGALLSVF